MEARSTMKNKEHNRKCPLCKKDLYYTIKANLIKAIESNKSCRSCSSKKRSQKPEYKKIHSNFIERFCSKGSNVGSNNPFYGKKHTEETKQKLRDNTDRSYTQTQDFKNKQSAAHSGSKNNMYGKTVYGVWVEKYGVEEANRLKEIRREKQSIATSGKNNPMYGKPSPQGSGNGWSGWYKGWYFRSLRELSYAVGLDKNNLSWQSAEHIKIPYKDWKGKDRTYHPDFLINEKTIVEIKPTKLKNSPSVVCKKIAAEQFCSKKGYNYELIDPSVLKIEDLVKLKETGLIKFTDKYEKLFLKWQKQ